MADCAHASVWRRGRRDGGHGSRRDGRHGSRRPAGATQVSAHPIFRDSAYVMGNTNEPSRGPPSMELQEMQVALLDDCDPLMVRAGVRQPAEGAAYFARFVLEQRRHGARAHGRG